MDIRFVRYSGAGNILIIIDEMDEIVVDESDKSDFAVQHCRDIDADDIIFLQKSEVADTRMRLIGPDGSESEMCGNGVRCIGDYILKNRLKDSRVCTIETKGNAEEWNPIKGIFNGGVVPVQMTDGKIPELASSGQQYSVDIGNVTFDVDHMPSVHNGANEGSQYEKEIVDFEYAIDIENLPVSKENIIPSSLQASLAYNGEPHFIIFCDEVNLGTRENKFMDRHVVLKGIKMTTDTIEMLSKSIKGDTRYFHDKGEDIGVNVNFVQKTNGDKLRIITSERGGAGITQACGTGSTAAAAVYMDTSDSRRIFVENTGGVLMVEKNERGYTLTGPAKEIAEGIIVS